MLTKEQIKTNISNYKIENGVVIDKNTNKPIIDEEKILEIKTSIMMYREAKKLFAERKRGAPEEQDYYIEKALKVYGLNGEINDYPQNKIIREIINNNGPLTIAYGGNDLSVSEKFSFLCAPKKDYGLATIKYMAHQKGIDISNLDVSIDLSTFQKTGVSNVSIKYDKQPYQKKTNPTIESTNIDKSNQPLYQHPMAKELNELEKQKQVAKQNGDDVAYEYAQKNIEKIISENQATINPKQWDTMSLDEQISFINTKINESKILHDKDSFDYWNANLTNIMSKKSYVVSTENIEQDKEIKQDPKQSPSLDFIEMINQLRKQNTLINQEYKKMLADGIIDNEELATLINKLKDLSNNALLIKSMVTDKNQETMINSIIEMINQESTKMTTITNIEKDRKQQTSNSLDFSIMINQLRKQNALISQEYKKMLEDGVIDDEELATLINKLKDLSNNALLIKSMVTDKNQEMMINSIIEMIDQENIKMTTMQRGIEETNHNFGI